MASVLWDLSGTKELFRQANSDGLLSPGPSGKFDAQGSYRSNNLCLETISRLLLPN